MALVINHGPRDDETAVAIPRPRYDEMGKAIDCQWVEKWPYQYQVDTVHAANGNKYRFDIWVDEQGVIADKPYNGCASLVAHPFAQVKGFEIYGKALILPLSTSIKYTLEDWDAICSGVWGLGCECKYCEADEDVPKDYIGCKVAAVERTLAAGNAHSVRVIGEKKKGAKAGPPPVFEADNPMILRRTDYPAAPPAPKIPITDADLLDLLGI